MRIATPALILSSLLLAAGVALAEARDFGATVTLEEPTPIASVVAAPERFGDAPVLLEGRLTDLCTKKGCWTVIAEGDAFLRVRFEDYGFFLPQDALGTKARVQGVAEVRELSEKEARHIAAESRDGDPGAIEGPQRQVGFLASGVRLLGAD